MQESQKSNIVSKTTGHHQCCGCIYGFGSQWEFRIDKTAHSSDSQCKTHKGYEHFGTEL